MRSASSSRRERRWRRNGWRTRTKANRLHVVRQDVLAVQRHLRIRLPSLRERTAEARLISPDEFFPEFAPLSDARCDVCLGRLKERPEGPGADRKRHDECRKAKKRERTRWGREA